MIFYLIFSKIRLNTSPITVKKQNRIPPNIIPIVFPTLSFAKGKMGLSITCIKGVSFRTVTLANSVCLTNSVNIAVLA